MKNLILTIAVFITASWSCIAQSPDDLWTKTYGGSSSEVACSIQQTYDSGFIIASYTSSYDGDMHYGSDFWIVKLNGDPCYDPADLSAKSLSPTSVELLWEENGTATQWEIMLDTAGFDTTGFVPFTVNANPFIWDGLLPDTEYDYYVRADCRDRGYSNWIGPSSFFTDCAAEFYAPLFEDFETTEIGGIPHCWRTVNASPEKFSIGVCCPTNKRMVMHMDKPYAPLMLITPQLNGLAD
jgi:hypothetical protein